MSDEWEEPVLSMDLVRRLLLVIEHASFPYGKTDEDDKAIAEAEALVADKADHSWLGNAP